MICIYINLLHSLKLFYESLLGNILGFLNVMSIIVPLMHTLSYGCLFRIMPKEEKKLYRLMSGVKALWRKGWNMLSSR